jgi:hypothetical protein
MITCKPGDVAQIEIIGHFGFRLLNNLTWFSLLMKMKKQVGSECNRVC